MMRRLIFAAADDPHVRRFVHKHGMRLGAARFVDPFGSANHALAMPRTVVVLDLGPELQRLDVRHDRAGGLGMSNVE